MKFLRNLVDNINLCTIILQSFSYFGCFALKLCTVKNMLQMGTTALEISLRRHPKLSITQTDLSFEISQIFAVFSVELKGTKKI